MESVARHMWHMWLKVCGVEIVVLDPSLTTASVAMIMVPVYSSWIARAASTNSSDISVAPACSEPSGNSSSSIEAGSDACKLSARPNLDAVDSFLLPTDLRYALRLNFKFSRAVCTAMSIWQKCVSSKVTGKYSCRDQVSFTCSTTSCTATEVKTWSFGT